MMNDPIMSSALTGHRPQRDRGAILTFVLAFTVMAGMAVVAILGFASVVFRNRPPLDIRNSTAETAESAIRMAITFQRDTGPEGCFNGGGVSQLANTAEFNDMQVEFTCTELAGVENYAESGRSRFGLITTSNSTVGTESGIRGRSTPGYPVKEISGNVYLNGGDLTTDLTDIGLRTLTGSAFVSALPATATPVPQRYLVPGAPTVPPALPAAPTPEVCATLALDNAFPDYVAADGSAVTQASAGCDALPWYAFAGDVWNEAPGNRVYPVLPTLPTFLRSPNPNELANGCQVLYPGRYEDTVVLDGASGSGKYYLASGVYYFANPLQIINGAEVVGGEGKYTDGCFDADAAFDRFGVWSPKNHEITGDGVTLLFGDDANLLITDASVRLNRRISTPGTRGSEGISIRSVNFGSKTNVEIPPDQVQVGEYPLGASGKPDPELRVAGSTVAASLHTIKVADVDYQYRQSTLGTASEIVRFQVTPASGTSTPTFLVEGYTFVPNAGVTIETGTRSNYAIDLAGGVVTTNLDLDVGVPSDSGNGFAISASSRPIQRRVQLAAEVTAPDGSTARSFALVQIHANGSYAINSWGVDPDAGAPTTVAATTTTTTVAPTTTLPPAATTTTATTTTTTTTVPPATTTTLPPTTTTTPPAIPSTPANSSCNISSNPNGWNRNFGPGQWTAEFWNWGSPRPNFNSSSPFSGSPSETTTVSNVALCGTSSPLFGVQSDKFSARFTKTWTLTSPQTVTFLAGGDDGFRLRVNGSIVVGDWTDHGHKWLTTTVTLPAGTHTLEFEFYENGGSNTYQLWKN